MLKNEDLLKLSHKVGQSGHWFLRLVDHTLFWSPEVFRLHGLSTDAAQPDLANALDFYHPKDRERIEALVKDALRERGSLAFEARILQPGGQVRWVEVLGEFKLDQDNATEYLFGVFRDITDNQRQRLHNQRLAWVLENTEEAIVMTDTVGRITWANRAFEQISGYSLEQASGRKPGELLQGPKSDPTTIAHMRECLSRNANFACEVLNYAKDGNAYWIRISCQPEFDADGELRGYTAIQTDITNEKQSRLDLQAEIEARSRLEEKLRHLASHDELSGLPNRRHFMQQANDELARCKRYQRPLSVLMVDLDHFKRINDHHGHGAGDEVIEAFAERCRAILRETDTPARIGGEEFAILLPETDTQAAVRTAERLRRQIGKTPVQTSAGEIMVTISIGVASLSEQCQDIESMLKRADDHLYRAKQDGRDRISA